MLNRARHWLYTLILIPALALGLTAGCREETPAAPPAASPPQETPPGPPAPPLSLLRLGPSGDLPRLTQVTAMFDQPMVPLGDYGRVPEGALVLSPDLPGRRVWLNQHTLAFLPEKPLTGSLRLKAVLKADRLAALSGARLAADAEAEIRLPLLAAAAASRLDEDAPDRAAALRPRWRVTFNQPPDEADLARLAGFALENGPILAAAAEKAPDEAHTFIFTAAGELPPDTPYRLILKAGARSLAGPLPAPALTLAEGRTFGPLTVNWDNPQDPDLAAWGPGWSPPLLTFSNPVEWARVLPLLNLSPAFDLEPTRRAYAPEPAAPEPAADEEPGAEEDGGRFGRFLYLRGPLLADQDYTLTVDPAARDAYGQPLTPAAPLTFRTKSFPSYLDLGDEYALMETAGPLRAPLRVSNLARAEIEGYALNAEQAVRFLAAGGFSQHWGDVNRAAAVLREIAPRRLTLRPPDGAKDRPLTLPLDLAEIFGDDRLGHLLLLSAQWPAPEDDGDRRTHALIQISDLGLAVKTGTDSLLVWVTNLATGRVWPGADLELRAEDGRILWSGRSGADGLASLPVPAGLFGAEKDPDRRFYVVARASGQMALWDLDWQSGLENWRWSVDQAFTRHGARTAGEEDQHWLLNALPLYRPGETAKFKLIARLGAGDLLREPAGEELDLELRDPLGETTGRARLTAGRFGTVSHEFRLPPEAHLGRWSVWAGPAGGRLGEAGGFLVQTYRPPAFEVKIEGRPAAALAGDRVELGLQADYHFGAPAAGRPARYGLSAAPASFRLPGPFAGYSVEDYFTRADEEDDGPQARLETEEMVAAAERDLDQSGSLKFTADLTSPAGRPPRPRQFTVRATVTDVDDRPVSTSAGFLVHPAAVYAGLSAPGLGRAGEPLAVKLVAADLEGRPVPGLTIEAALHRRTWRTVRRKTAGSAYDYVSRLLDEPVAETRLTSGDEPVEWVVAPDQPGHYWVSAAVKDQAGRPNRAALDFYLAGAGAPGWLTTGEDEPLTLVPDKNEYRPGETAKILVQSPFDSGEGLWTVERSGIRRSGVFTLGGGRAPVLEIPVLEEDAPNLFVSVLLFRGRLAAPAGEKNLDFGKPALRAGYVELKVPGQAGLLTVDVDVQPPEAGPGEEATVSLAVTDRHGRPFPEAEVALAAADAAVIQLAGDETYHPETIYHRDFPLLVQTASNLFSLVSREDFGDKGGDPGGGGGSVTAEAAEAVRRAFAALAFFEPALPLDEQGRASVKIKLPENLTTFKIFAVATGHGRLTGTGQAQVLVTRDLLVRQSLPHYAAPNDEFSAAAVVSNRGRRSGLARVTLAGENFSSLEPNLEKTVTVGPGESREVAFRVRAGSEPEAKFLFSVEMGRDRDRAEFTLPVLPSSPLTTEGAFSLLTESASLALAPPPGADPGRGGLEVELAPTLLGVLKEPLEWLRTYPHRCLEQTISRAWGALLTLTLGDRLALPAERLEEAGRLLNRTLAELGPWAEDGGYNFWPGDHSWEHRSVYLTAYALDFLLTAREAGLDPPDRGLTDSVVSFLRNYHYGQDRPSGRARLSPGAETEAQAYALAQLARAGAPVAADVEILYQKRESLSLTALANLLRAVNFLPETASNEETERQKELRDRLESGLRPTPAGFAPADAGPGPREIWSSPERTAALILTALTEAAPDSPYLPGLARGLAAEARGGHFGSTQANVTALISLAAAAEALETRSPDLTVRAAFDQGEPFVEGRVKSFSDPPLSGRAPLSALGGALNFELEGSGRLWAAVRLKSAPAEPDLSPWSSGGFHLSRDYAVVAPSPRAAAESFRRGEVLRVSVTLVVPERRYDVVLTDHVPAGFEPVNFNLADADQSWLALIDPEDGPDGRRFWYDHQEIWPDRVAVYAGRLEPGVYTFNYLARAATPGRYLTPGPAAEEMYAPENAGRGAGHTLTVEK